MKYERGRPVPVQSQTALFIGPSLANKDNLTPSKFPVDGARDRKVVIDNPPLGADCPGWPIDRPHQGDRIGLSIETTIVTARNEKVDGTSTADKGLGNKSPRAGHLKGAIFDNYPAVLVLSTWKCRLARRLSL